MAVNRSKHIWEGWTVGDFIDDLEPLLQNIMDGKSWMPVIKDKDALKRWCMDNQPYYKKYIPEVVKYFSNKFNIK